MKTDVLALIVFFMMGFNLCIPVIQKQIEIDTTTVKAEPLGDEPFNNLQGITYSDIQNNPDGDGIIIGSNVEFTMSESNTTYMIQDALFVDSVSIDEQALYFNEQIFKVEPEVGDAVVVIDYWRPRSFKFDLSVLEGNVDMVFGGFSPSTKYPLYVDEVFHSDLLPDASGTIFFSYSGPWSNHTFEVNDSENASEAYDYWYAPENSFGIQEMKTVNWSYFKSLFLAHTDWMLEYKRYEYSDWTDGSDYLTIERTWNDSGFWKFNLILDVPVDIYSARFTFGVDLPCLQYVERSGYEVWINYTANATETYSCMFNWSDIASIPDLVITKGVHDGMFWFRFRRDNIPTGHYEFDPTFGYTGTSSGGSTCNNYLIGSPGTPASSGTADYIAIKIYGDTWDSTEKIKCALYDCDDSYSFVAETEERSDGGTDWQNFVFDAPKPSVTSGVEYAIITWSDSTVEIHSQSGGSPNTYWYQALTYNSFPNPIGSPTSSYKKLVFCSYTEGAANNAPTQSAQKIWNSTTSTEKSLNATGVSLTPTCFNVTIADSDSDKMNITILTNESGTWTVVNQTSDGGLSDGTSSYYNTSWVDAYSTKYWISFNVTDSTDWCNETYHFTTESEEEWVTLDTWNITLGNMSISPYTLDTWNITLSNTPQPYILDTWNLTLGNLTIAPFTIDTWNITLSNLTISSFTIDTWNITLSNLTISSFTIDTWNITLSNTLQPYILDTWNITLSNTTEGIILDRWNITLSNLTISPYVLDTWNITLSNTPQPYILDTWNITLSNTPQSYALDQWNITLSNTSFFFITNVKATPSEAVINDVDINITCNVTSLYAIVNVTVNMTEGHYDMANIGDLYYYVAINSTIGTHYYHIYANDTSGDQLESSTYSFRIIGLSCSFTHIVIGGLMTLTPTITGATHYQWTFINETGVTGQTSWIPIEDMGSYIQGYVYPTTIRAILSAKNINFNQYANYSDVIRIYKSSFEKPEPTVDEPEPEPTNVFKEIADAVGKWFGERNTGEILFMVVIIVIAALFVIKKKYPQKKIIYHVLKKEKKKEKEKTPHEILIERIDRLEENVFPKKKKE